MARKITIKTRVQRSRQIIHNLIAGYRLAKGIMNPNTNGIKRRQELYSVSKESLRNLSEWDEVNKMIDNLPEKFQDLLDDYEPIKVLAKFFNIDFEEFLYRW